MKSCTWSSLDSPGKAPRLSAHDFNDAKHTSLAPKRLVRKPSKLQTTMEVTRCRLGNTSRQAAPIGCEDFYPQKDWTPISHAVYNDREGALRHFLDSGWSPNILSGPGVPLLCIATACGHFEIVEILLKAGANVNLASTEKGETAMHVAVRLGRHDIFDLLLLHQVDLQSRTSNSGQTALHYAAAMSSSTAQVRKLLDHGAAYELKDLQGQTPAAVALQAHNVHAAIAIISMARGKPEHLLREKSMLMHHLDRAKDRISISEEMVADVFTITCDPDSTVLIEVIKKNDTRLVKIFLERGADPQQANAKGLLPIVVAVKFADVRVIKLLVQHGADVTVKGPGHLNVLQIFFKTLTTRDEDSIVTIVEYLLAKGADIMALYSDGKTLLHRAVSANIDYAKAVKLLIQNGIGIDTRDDDGNTALHIAASNGLVNATKVLLDSHANVTTIDFKKRTALLRAIQNQQWHVVSLLAVSSVMTSWDAEGSKPLHHIAQSIPDARCSWKDIAAATRLFSERGICRSMRDRSGATPLILAIKSLPEDDLEIIQSLLTGGDRKWNCIGHEDHCGRDALYYAATLGKPVFVQMLLEHGAPLELEEWSDTKRQLSLPIELKHRILDLLVECDQSRSAHAAERQCDGISGTRIEIVRNTSRTSSALSGYHADCEVPRKARAVRNNSKRSLTTQHIRRELQQEPLDRHSILSTRTVGIQNLSNNPTALSRNPVHRTQATASSSFTLASTASVNARIVRFVQNSDQHTGIANRMHPNPSAEETESAFPPRVSSRRHLASHPAVATSRSTPIVYNSKSPAPTKIPIENASTVTKDFALREDPPTPREEKQAQPQSSQTSVEPVSTEHTTASMTTLAGATTIDQLSTVATTLLATTIPIQPTRIDSAVGLTQEARTSGSLSTPNLSRSSIDGTALKKERRRAEELASWLAISHMLDRM